MKGEKVTYLCRDGHVTKQWEDKKPPKHCSQWQAGKGCPLKPFDPESKQAEAQMVQMVADATPERRSAPRRRAQDKALTKVTTKRVTARKKKE